MTSNGAIREHNIAQLRSTPEFHTAVSQALPLLCERGQWDYVEAWVPSDITNEKIQSNEWYSVKSKVGVYSQLRKNVDEMFAPVGGAVHDAVKTLKPVWFNGLPAEKDIGTDRVKALREAGVKVKSGLVLPVYRNERILACFFFLSEEEVAARNAENRAKWTDAFSSFAIGMLSSSLFKSDEPMFGNIPGIPSGQMASVYRKIIEEGVFNAQVVYQEVDWYYKAGLQQYYWEVFTPAEIATHIHSFIAAKKLAQTTGKPEEIWFEVETPDKSNGFYLSNDDHKSVVTMENKVVSLIENVPRNQAYSYMSFASEGTVISNGRKKLHVAVFDTPKYSVGETNPSETDIWKIATGVFLRKPAEMRQRYQEIISASVGKLSPTFQVYPKYRDGTIPIMMCFKRGDGASQLARLTELLKYNQLHAKRKFVECFSNGLVVYSVYLDPCPQERIDHLLNQISLTVLVPRTELTDLFLTGRLSAEEYALASSAVNFVYYFTQQKSEEFEALANAFKDDALNLGRLKALQTKLKREAVNRKRIFEAVSNQAETVREIYALFAAKCSKGQSAEATAAQKQALLAKIFKSVNNERDALIMTSMVVFIDGIVKTNFFAPQKSALSFRLNPQFLNGTGLVPVVPFGLFMVMGYEFHGFHLRFDDIARGGIRMIRSANDQIYTSNFETVFQENYGLAHTQQKKNKDIPEGGSKGTILLNPANQNNAELAFQKYIAAMLDLLVEKPGVYNGYGKEEILFFGPDEGTADYMRWAAEYAGKRGYKYWKSVTTGKPPAIGGIPHDLFGMTTRSVHQMVLGCLAKAGLKEENVTKFQTGGPDGDLGSNEILLSKDKTVAIVDGSGVAYDPKGLDRAELTRLAKARLTVNNFSKSKLGPGGFVVLITEKDIRLPSGEVVENGRNFRDTFHLHPLAQADFFVPCGGRPEAVNLGNVSKLFDERGKPKFKFVVEGANLFLTQDARMVLEKAGVVLYKDASANKGGVTSSSMEVLAALSMDDAEFQKHMMVPGAEYPPKSYPPFYKKYVEEIQEKIVHNAALEFECIYQEHERTGKARCLLTDEVSEKINQLNHSIQRSALWDNVALRKKVLSEAVPKSLQELLGLDKIVDRIPVAYAKAIFGAYLASTFVYKNGLSAGNEFKFFEFMAQYTKV